MLHPTDRGYRARYINGKGPYGFHEALHIDMGIAQSIRGITDVGFLALAFFWNGLSCI